MTSATFDVKRLKEEADWLVAHPQFEERPATVREFVGPDYLNIAAKVRPAVMEELAAIIGEEIDPTHPTAYHKAIFTGGIGIGKTTIASIVLPYLAHWVLCLRDPQEFFNLLPGSRIAFMQMSTSGGQAKEVVFGDIKARIEHSPWFAQNYPHDSKFKNQLRFPKEIWILPGDSQETTFEGYNILGGILDEADSHQVTKNKDYAEEGYNTIHSRVTSRFQEKGFILVIGQMKKSNGFAARKFAEFQKDPEAYAVRMAIWESFGWDKYLRPDGTRDSFFYHIKRQEIIPQGVAHLLGDKDLIEVPTLYRKDFENKPEKALRDLAGIPPVVGSAFISLTSKITACQSRWTERYFGRSEGPIPKPNDYLPTFASWFRCYDRLPRTCHIDMAYSGNGDALGFAMAHVPEMWDIDGEAKPFICFDLLVRIKVPAGREIFIGDIRRMIYDLRDYKKFKIRNVTIDGFQSTDTIQQLNRRRIAADLLSVDRNLAPYEDLREAIYEDRVAFPPYLVKLEAGDIDTVDIAFKELSELIQEDKKVDHPENGSKDVADAMAGCAYTLMGDRTYHRKKMSSSLSPAEGGPSAGPSMGSPMGVGAMGSPGFSAPVPPVGPGVWRPPTGR